MELPTRCIKVSRLTPGKLQQRSVKSINEALIDRFAAAGFAVREASKSSGPGNLDPMPVTVLRVRRNIQ